MPLPMKGTTAYVDVFVGIHCTVAEQLAWAEWEDFIEDLGYVMSLISERDMTRWQEYAGFGRKTWTEVITWEV